MLWGALHRWPFSSDHLAVLVGKAFWNDKVSFVEDSGRCRHLYVFDCRSARKTVGEQQEWERRWMRESAMPQRGFSLLFPSLESILIRSQKVSLIPDRDASGLNKKCDHDSLMVSTLTLALAAASIRTPM